MANYSVSHTVFIGVYMVFIMCLLIAVENDRLSREHQSLKELYDKVQSSLSEERQTTVGHVQTLSDKLSDISALYEQEKLKRKEVQDQNSELRMLIDKYRAQVKETLINTNKRQ